MLRKLLAERFGLSCHIETRTAEVYALVVAKGGPKFGQQFHVRQEQEREPLGPGPSGLALRGTMARLASTITVYLRRPFPSSGAAPVVPYEPLPVVDQTNLPGEYTVFLDLQKNRDWHVVLTEQLGLSLVLRKVPVRTLFIDRAVLPGEN
jgi:uncharacterized protein (TIGR03435 family)